MAATLAGVLRPVVFLVLFCRFYEQNCDILDGVILQDVSEFILSKNWVKNGCFSMFEQSIAKLAGRDGSQLKHVNKRLSMTQDHEKTFSLSLILLSCGDISQNPGPVNYKYPCGICAKAVRKYQNGICCDGCNLWHHLKCLDMTNETFNFLSQHENTDWYCLTCSIPQFTDSFFETSSTHSHADSDAGIWQYLHPGTPRVEN